MPLKLNIAFAHIEETCCEELLLMKGRIKIFCDGESQKMSLSQASMYTYSLGVVIEGGSLLKLAFCPYCGENLGYEVTLNSILGLRED